jgi:hemerythrin
MLPKWNDKLLTGNDTIDFQHQELFRRLTHLFEAARQGKGRESLQEFMVFLGNHISEHFADEEELQRNSSYPGLDDHMEHHKVLATKFNNLRRQYEKEGGSLKFLNDSMIEFGRWVEEHILIIDKKFISYLAEKAKKENPVQIG